MLEWSIFKKSEFRMISRYKLLFCDYQSLPPISSQHFYKIYNQPAIQTSPKPFSQPVSSSRSELLPTNQIANKTFKALTNQRKEFHRKKMQTNDSFRKPTGSPFRRPLIPTERKSPTNEVKYSKKYIEINFWLKNQRSTSSPIKTKATEIRVSLKWSLIRTVSH